LPAGVMIAMNGPTPSANMGEAVAFPGMLSDSSAVAASSSEAFGTVPLPAFGPIAPERPAMGLPFETRIELASLSYAETPQTKASMIFAALEQPAMSGGYIAAGSFTTARDAEQLARSLSAYGKTALETSDIDGTTWYSVNLYADGRNSVDAMLEAAWSIGASDAMTIRD
jgi:rare lipoprotein A